MGLTPNLTFSELWTHFTPTALWHYYVTYLWNYEQHSWVDKTASTFRVLSILVLLPLGALAFMDIASYMIARTLGVIDDTRASTSDKTTTNPALRLSPIRESSPIPDIRVESPGVSAVTAIPVQGLSFPIVGKAEEEGDRVLVEGEDTSHPHAYFTTEESNLKLSGAAVFSPANSQPPSPTVSRRQLKEDNGPLHGSASGIASLAMTSLASSETDSDDGVLHMALRRRT